MLNDAKHTSNTPSLVTRVLYWALVTFTASLVFIFFLRNSGVNGQEPASINKLLAGAAEKPYVFRVLLPALAKTASTFMDQEAALSIGTQAEAILGNRVFRRDLDGKRHPREVLVILAMMYLSLIGFAITVWHLLRELGYPRLIRQAGPPLLLLGSILFMQFGYIYDFTTLFLFSLGCLLMQRQQWLAYLFVFAGATLNKETAIFLSVIFGLSFLARLPRRRFILLLACQVVIYVLLQGAIRYAFRESPGSLLPSGFAGQMAALRGLASDGPLVLLWWVMWWLLAAALIAYGWSEKPAILRAGLAAMAFLLILYLAGGFPSEIRVFLEVYPLVAILMLPPPWTSVVPAIHDEAEAAPELRR